MKKLKHKGEKLRFEPEDAHRTLGGRLRGRGPIPAGENRLDPRLRQASLLILATFVLLSGRLIYLQVFCGEQYYRRSTDNFVKEIEQPAVRGQIRDRNGKVLAENRPSYGVSVTPRYLTDEALRRLRHYLDLSDDQFATLWHKIESKKGLERYRAVLAFDDITRDQMAMLESEKQDLPGIEVEVRAHRSYPLGPLATHLVGYLNMISAEDLSQHKAGSYHPGDYIGRSGLERLLESHLRGAAGSEKVIVDARGQRKSNAELIKFIGGGETRKDPAPGNNVVLTLDLELQKILQGALAKHQSAAAAVVEVETGRVLALGSYPGPDPNVLTGRLSFAEAERLSTDLFHPLLDKTLRENYYPGSTFKIVPALAALEDHLINPEEKVVCRGSYDLGRHAFHCMKSHGPMNLHDAVVQSCNVYFYHLAEKVGIDRMAKTAQQFGFGQPTGFGLGEVPGFVPTVDYYKQHGGFRVGYALNTAIGQGSVKVTVLQLAMAYSAMANGGRLYKPLIVDRVETPSGAVVEQYSPELKSRLSASPDAMERIRAALHGVVNDPKGTSYTAHIEGLDVAGKSGTAQVRKNHKGEATGWDTGNDHAWFAGFAPSRHAKIAVAVLVEHGGLGGHVAAPTAMEIIRGYFNQVAREQRPKVVLEDNPVRLKTPLPTASGVR